MEQDADASPLANAEKHAQPHGHAHSRSRGESHHQHENGPDNPHHGNHNEGNTDKAIEASNAEPISELSWSVVCVIYACGTGMCATLLVLHYGVRVEQVEGFWLIFSAFPFCLAYAMYQRGRALQRELALKKID